MTDQQRITFLERRIAELRKQLKEACNVRDRLVITEEQRRGVSGYDGSKK